MLVLCPCCAGSGKVLDGNGAGLTGMERQIFEIVRNTQDRGITIKRLTDKVYAGNSDGGPMTAEDCVRVRICHMNKKLSKLGMRIRAEHRGGGHTGYGAPYRVVSL